MARPGITVAGNPAPIQTSYAYEHGIRGFAERRTTFKGEQQSMFAAYKGLRTNAARASIRQEGAVATAEFVFNGIDIVDTVEIDFNSSAREWWTCPAYATLTKSERLAIAGKVREIARYAEDGHTLGEIDAETTRLSNLLGSLAPIFEDIILNGETYQALLPVITFTRTVAHYYGNPYEILDIGKVFSTAAMNANVPVNPQFVVAEIINTIGVNSGQTLGWLKHGRYGVSSDGSSQYIQQYTFDSYPTARYTFVTV